MSGCRPYRMNLVQQRLVIFAILIAGAAAAVAYLRAQLHRQAQVSARLHHDALMLSCANHGEIVQLTLKTPSDTFVAARTAPTINAVEGAPQPEQPTAWQLTAPLALPAEGMIIDAITQSACALTRHAWASPPGQSPAPDLASFNLAQPVFELTLGFADGATQTLYAGDKSPFDGGLYVRGPQKDAPVATVDGAFAFQLDKDLYALRDKLIVHVTPDEITQVRLTSNLPTVTAFSLTRTPQGFTLTTLPQQGRNSAALPVQNHPADGSAANTLLSALAQMRAKSFLSQTPTTAQLAYYGLSRPRLVVSITTADEHTHVVRLGSISVGGEIHHFAQATDAQHPIVELPSDYVVEKLEVGSDALRDLRIVHVDTQEVVAFALNRGPQTLSFIRRQTTEQEASGADPNSAPLRAGDVIWHMQDPEPAPVQQTDVHGLLFRLAGTRGASQLTQRATSQELAAANLLEPCGSIEFFAADRRPLGTIRIGRRDNQDRLVTDDHQEIISRIPASLFDDLDLSATAWRSTQATLPQ